MMNAVCHHNPVADHLKWSHWQYLSERIGIVQLCVVGIVYSGNYVPVMESPHPLLAAIVGGSTTAENPSSIVVHFQREGEGGNHSHFLDNVRRIVP